MQSTGIWTAHATQEQGHRLAAHARKCAQPAPDVHGCFGAQEAGQRVFRSCCGRLGRTFLEQ
eukprot:3407274-Amphidinium_carterae.1